MLDFSQFSVLTFDCYGTLIDWESGLIPVLRGLLTDYAQQAEDCRLLETFAGLEAQAERGDYKPYRQVLEEVGTKFAAAGGLELRARDQSLVESLPHWPPFGDTQESLQRLKSRYKLGVISNVDDDLFAGTAPKLGVEFDYFISAQQVKSYKPSPANFIAAIERIGEPPEKILHVAQSLYHDIAPASSLGLNTVWVNRRGNEKGSGATPPASARPTLEVPSLKALADLAT